KNLQACFGKFLAHRVLERLEWWPLWEKGIALMDSLPTSLMLAYFFWDYFLGHQMSHVAYASQGVGSMPAYLPFFGLSARILGVVFLIYFGYISRWYLPVTLYALGY